MKGLRTRGVSPGPRLDSLVVCSYNCGAAAVRRLLKRRIGDPADASADDLYRMLATHSPKETRDYLTKVTARRENWEAH